MTLSQTALVDAEALRQLRQLLDRALGTDDSDVVQGGHQLEAVQGGAHAQSVSPTQAAGVVSPSRIPDWRTLPETIREKVLQDLARMFRDRLDQNAGDQKQGGSSNE
jgi:hypothetical protein